MISVLYVFVNGAVGVSQVFYESMSNLSGCVPHIMCFATSLVTPD